MSRNGSGTYSLPAGNPVVTGTTISSTWANNTMNDLAAALTDSVAADGQTPMTGNLDLNTHKIVNLVAGSASGEAVEFAQFKTPTFTGNVTCTGTGHILSPAGTTAQRTGTPSDGMFRYNTDENSFEGYIDGAWGGISGAQANGVIYENNLVISANYTLTTGKNGFSVGPITISGGVSVTIPSGQRWVVL